MSDSAASPAAAMPPADTHDTSLTARTATTDPAASDQATTGTLPIPKPGEPGTQQTSAYTLIGGDEPVRALTDRFYDLMDLEPQYAHLRAMHPPSLDGSRDKLYWFLSGWLGGPRLYEERYGHPRLRARHLPFSIGAVERDQWMRCMAQAIDELGIVDPLKARLLAAFLHTADWMRNNGH